VFAVKLQFAIFPCAQHKNTAACRVFCFLLHVGLLLVCYRFFSVWFCQTITLSRFLVTINGVWIGNRIYWTYTIRYHTSQISRWDTRYSQSVTVFNNHYLVAASNGGSSSLFCVPELFQASSTSFSQKQLTTTPVVIQLTATPNLSCL
jgi:hypothetical protein